MVPPPFFHTIVATIQIFAGTVNVMAASFILKMLIATLNVLLMLSTYLLARKFFGIGTAIASAAIDNKIFVIAEQTLHIYDIETDRWSYGADLPTYINGLAAIATSGVLAPKRLHVVGPDVHFVYNPETDEWTSATPIPNSRYQVELAVVNDEIYAIGGGNNQGEYGYQTLSTNEKYTPIGYIPEFPSWIILPLFLTVTLIGILVRKKLKKVEH